ncbi:farnesyl pyrophosphate synthase, partial [Armillaria nabsnona]
QELVDYITGEGMLKDAIQWYERLIMITEPRPGGKLNRGMFCRRHRRDHQGDPLTDEYPKVALLGWAFELFQGFFLVSNDMMDALIRRRGQPCWYRVSKVVQIVINDSFILEAAIYYRISAGRSLIFWSLSGDDVPDREGQLITAPEDEVYLSKFSLKSIHSLTMIYKTVYYSFYLPVAVAARPTILPLWEPNH